MYIYIYIYMYRVKCLAVEAHLPAAATWIFVCA